jgi:hypothetical protein
MMHDRKTESANGITDKKKRGEYADENAQRQLVRSISMIYISSF